MRLIPGETKVKLEIFRGVYLGDLIVGLVTALLLTLVIVSNTPLKILIAILVIVLAGFLLARIAAGEPTYLRILKILRFFVLPKKFERVFDDDRLYEKAIGELREEYLDEYERSMKDEPTADDASEPAKLAALKNWFSGSRFMDDLMPFTGIGGGFIEYNGEYYGTVLSITPVEFRFMTEKERNTAIEDGLGSVLRVLPPKYAANIVKLDRPILYDDYLESEYDKLEELRVSYEKAMIGEDELKARVEVSYDRIHALRNLCYQDKVLSSAFYLVLFDTEKAALSDKTDEVLSLLEKSGVSARRLDTQELAVFLKYSNQVDFEERDIDEIEAEDNAMWAMPEQVEVTPHYVKIGNLLTYNFKVTGYPPMANNAWMAKVMAVPGTKVVVKVSPVERDKAVHDIDRSLEELRGRLQGARSESRQIEMASQIESLSGLLTLLQEENETLVDVSVYVTAYDVVATENEGKEIFSILPRYDNMAETVQRIFREDGFSLNRMDYSQIDAFVGSQISGYNPSERTARAMPSNTVAAVFPWIYSRVSDIGGINLGRRDNVPVFIDFFKRTEDRVNSNVVIVGKTGSGKSYATKALLTNLAGDDSKIFILDPENEYGVLAENLNGNVINVGNASAGRLNPFHIMTDLDDDEGAADGVTNSYATHLQFLEEFFKQILPDCDADALEYLSTLVERTYNEKGITAETDFSKLQPEDYPIFDDLYDQVLFEFEKTGNDYLRSALRALVNYIGKFSTGGRNAAIWNGASTITTDSNFTVFNFQTILANRNNTIANAQMLLILKYIDNEIIKNRDYNLRHGLNRKVVVVIDEAHVFIDSKFPIALDFMYQLAKRIRKYNGMQIVITQNIRDFVGNEEVAAKSSAIINACQYSLIFPLAPNDVRDLCTLYEKAGGINEKEQEEIVSAPRGQAFTILSPTARSTFLVDVGADLTEMFENEDFVSGYFVGRVGQDAWDDFIGESRSRHILSETEEEMRAFMEDEEEDDANVLRLSGISFSIEGEDGTDEPLMLGDMTILNVGDEDAADADGEAAAASAIETYSMADATSGDAADTGDAANATTPPPATNNFDGERFMEMMLGEENYKALLASLRERILQEIKEEMKQ